MIKRKALAASCLLALAGCGEPEADETAVAPEPVLTPNATPGVAPDGGALAPGSWNIGEDATGATAIYGVDGSEATLAFSCNTSTRELTMGLPGTESGEFIIDAGGTAAQVSMTSNGQDTVAAIDPGAPVFAAATDPAVVIIISSPGGATVRVPGAAGIRRVLESCS